MNTNDQQANLEKSNLKQKHITTGVGIFGTIAMQQYLPVVISNAPHINNALDSLF